MPDGPGAFLLRDPVLNAQGAQFLPRVQVRQHVHQVVVHIVRPQPLQLLPEALLNGFGGVDHVLGQFRGNPDLLPQAVALHNLPQAFLAAGVDVGGVKIVDAQFHGPEDFLFRLRRINRSPVPGKPHAAESQCGPVQAARAFTVLHSVLLLSSVQAKAPAFTSSCPFPVFSGSAESPSPIPRRRRQYGPSGKCCPAGTGPGRPAGPDRGSPPG